MRWWWLFIGGGLGASARYALAGLVQARSGAAFPWGTFAVNVAGCFVIGLLATLLEEHSVVPPNVRLFLLVGVLGGFTTFSSFGLETFRLLQGGEWLAAAGNAFGSVTAGLVAVAGGVVLGRILA